MAGSDQTRLSRVGRFERYGLVAALIAGAALIRLALDPWLGIGAVFLLFVPAVLAAAAEGMWPALAATSVSLAVGVALLLRHPQTAGSYIDAGLFALLGLSIGLVGQSLQRTRSVADKLNRAVTEREAHLQSILDTVPDAMIVIDETGLMRSFSPAAEKMFQRRAEEVIGRNVSILMPAPDSEAHDAYIARYRDSGERRIIGLPRVVTAQRKDGSPVPVRLFVGETRIGGSRFFTGFLQDLTEQQAAETRVRALQSELIHISRLSAMGEMATALAHELNQPLSAIANFLKGGQRLLEGENAESRALPAIERAAEQSLRAGEIIRRMREFVTGGQSERTSESLQRLIEESLALGLVGARERSVVTRSRFTAAVDKVGVDKVQVQQVVLNLVRNALEAMDGSARRELEVATGQGEDGMAVVSVSDTGPGISPEIADRLFQPFVTTKGARGMGVGLSICRTIVEAHGGRIWTEVNPGGGAVFRFSLPPARGTTT